MLIPGTGGGRRPVPWTTGCAARILPRRIHGDRHGRATERSGGRTGEEGFLPGVECWLRSHRGYVTLTDRQFDRVFLLFERLDAMTASPAETTPLVSLKAVSRIKPGRVRTETQMG